MDRIFLVCTDRKEGPFLLSVSVRSTPTPGLIVERNTAEGINEVTNPLTETAHGLIFCFLSKISACGFIMMKLMNISDDLKNHQ